jgi:hypothetical protein
MRYIYTSPSVAYPTTFYLSAPSRFISEIIASEIDRSERR